MILRPCSRRLSLKSPPSLSLSSSVPRWMAMRIHSAVPTDFSTRSARSVSPTPRAYATRSALSWTVGFAFQSKAGEDRTPVATTIKAMIVFIGIVRLFFKSFQVEH